MSEANKSAPTPEQIAYTQQVCVEAQKAHRPPNWATAPQDMFCALCGFAAWPCTVYINATHRLEWIDAGCPL